MIALNNNLSEKSDCTLTDERLVKQTQNGDNLAFNILFDRYLPVIQMKSNGYINVDKDDLIQEGLLGLWGAVQTYNPTKNTLFKTYANKCIDNRMISGLKRSKRKKHIPLDMLVYIDDEEFVGIKNVSESPEQNMIEKENYAGFIKHIENLLSKKEFNILSYYIAGNSYRNIAKIMKCDVKAVDNAIQRIRKKLHKHYS